MRPALFFFILGLAAAVAQESPSPSPASSPAPTLLPSPSVAPPREVPLRFALPPLEGTISLGVYDQNGKLVRVLHREDTIAEFTPGHDALETSWDGNDDEGRPLPNGKYRARGYVVGDLKVEGIDYFFNDWVTDENSPHIRSLGGLWMENSELQLNADLAGGKTTGLICDQKTGAILKQTDPHVPIHCDRLPPLPNLISPVDCAPGKDGTTWFIDSLAGAGPCEVKQLASDHALLRRLSYAADDPQPVRIEASPTEETIFLVEQNDHLQRLRALTLVRTTTENGDELVSDWKPAFEKTITGHQNFGLENGIPVADSATPQKSSAAISQHLRPDPLQNDKPGRVELAIGIDPDGSFLRTADGLPLRTISETPHLIRVLPARPNDETIDAFQDDGAVVEQFRISNLTQMIAFDCGEFELK